MLNTKKVFVVGRNYSVETMFTTYKGSDWKYVIGNREDKNLDLVVFSGGPDVNPKFYAEAPLHTTHSNKARDDLDLEFFNRFPNLPKLGICRGGQFLNVLSGGWLWQHVDNHQTDHRMLNLLHIDGKPMPSSMTVTSTHHQMMIPGPAGIELGIAVHEEVEHRGLSSIYYSAVKKDRPRHDTEVVWYPTTNSLCFQPHPEHKSSSPVCRDYMFSLLDHFFWD